MRPSRLISVTAAAVLACLLVTPAALAGSATHTLRVDDDGLAGPGGCDGTDPVPRHLQGAVDAAHPGDTILVCPGTYAGWVTVRTDDLTIIGTRPWAATLLPGRPRMVDGGQHQPSHITVVGASGVRIQWLRFRVDTNGATAAAARRAHRIGGVIPCGAFAAVRVQGGSQDVVVRANRMRAFGSGTLGWCGLGSAVIVGEGSTAWVGYNAARDFRDQGFLATGRDTAVTFHRNSVRFWHPEAPVPQGCFLGAGIVFTNGATGAATRDRVYGRPTAAVGETPLLCPGIYLPEAGPGIVLRGNLVQWAYDGINLAAARDVTVEGNRILDSVNDGIRASYTSGSRIEANVVRRALRFGIVIGDGATTAARHGDGTGNRFVRNTSTGAGDAACVDTTHGGGTLGTGNRWIGNHGDGPATPDGLCPAA